MILLGMETYQKLNKIKSSTLLLTIETLCKKFNKWIKNGRSTFGLFFAWLPTIFVTRNLKFHQTHHHCQQQLHNHDLIVLIVTKNAIKLNVTIIVKASWL